MADHPEPQPLTAEREIGRRIMALGYEVHGGTEVVARSQVLRVVHEVLAAERARTPEAGLREAPRRDPPRPRAGCRTLMTPYCILGRRPPQSPTVDLTTSERAPGES